MHKPILSRQDLGPDDEFKFACYPGIKCFNVCCHDVTLVLSPYDALRLRKALGLPPARFLEEYTDMHLGDLTQIPVVRLKMKADLTCPFVTPEGCSVYQDRPSSCRAYPLARFTMRNRKTGEIIERYKIVRESHCEGHFEDRLWRVRDWIKDQGLLPYHEMNDLFGELILLRQKMADSPLSADDLDAIYTACYLPDRFVEIVRQQDFASRYGFAPETIEKGLSEETELLKLGFNWLKKTVFKEALEKG
ncbi:YkgJ family cysteine cluster protein [Thermosulfuriphilus sp.]